jgi:hypothetical protein
MVSLLEYLASGLVTIFDRWVRHKNLAGGLVAIFDR